MTPFRSALIWAAMMLLVAAANRWLLIDDKDAFAMFAVLPALWVTTSRPNRCNSARRAEAAR